MTKFETFFSKIVENNNISMNNTGNQNNNMNTSTQNNNTNTSTNNNNNNTNTSTQNNNTNTSTNNNTNTSTQNNNQNQVKFDQLLQDFNNPNKKLNNIKDLSQYGFNIK